MHIAAGQSKCPRCAASPLAWRRYRYKGIPVIVCMLCGLDSIRRRGPTRAEQPPEGYKMGFHAGDPKRRAPAGLRETNAERRRQLADTG